ncbi:MAG TPA: hypothetical protein VMU67_00560 [Steroidobacteraceae bacterium]|nr:hypothetical protein [Steroidobacteraceae bacterium]
MSAVHREQAEWLDPRFWDRLDRLESHHRQIQSDHEVARRRLDRTDPAAMRELHEAWQSYCKVIAELDRAAAELETLWSSVP